MGEPKTVPWQEPAGKAVEAARRPERSRRLYGLLGRPTLFVLDLVLFYAATILALKLSPAFGASILEGVVPYGGLAVYWIGLPAVTAISSYVFGLQTLLERRRLLQLAALSVVVVAVALIGYNAVLALTRFELLGRWVSVIYFPIAAFLVFGSRALLARLLDRVKLRVGMIGSADTANKLAAEVATTQIPVDLEGIGTKFAGEEEPVGELSSGEMELEDLLALLRSERYDELIVEVDKVAEPKVRAGLMEAVRRGVRVTSVEKFYESQLFQVNAAGLEEEWFWNQDPAHDHPVFSFAKRVLDIVLALVGLACMVVIGPLIALAIWMEDKGAPFYRQERVGRYGRPFGLWKFRTMTTNAEKDGGVQWAQKGDARVTRVGRVLRKTRLDETPQFWNVLKGEMSFAGPRPERPEFVAELSEILPYYDYRHLVKPGITGWAQIHYGYGASVEDAAVKLNYDLYYLKYASPLLEIQILLGTIVAMIKGAR